MRRNVGREKLIITALSLVVAGCFAAMIALALGGCAEDDDDPVPQENADGDLVPDPDNGDGAPIAERTSAIAATGPIRYDRNKALEYIDRFALTPNRQTAYCTGIDRMTLARDREDCTNFASQVLWYGGLPMSGFTSAGSGWWYAFSCTDDGSSRSWRQVNGLVTYLISESGLAEFRPHARDLKIGDLIFYRLRRKESGYRCDVGNLFNHTTVVSGFDARGEPLVSYHSNEAQDVPWDVKTGSLKTLGEACAVGFVHIRD